MEPTAQFSCSGNCLIHLHSAAGEAWMKRDANFNTQQLDRDGIPRFLAILSNNEQKFLYAHEIRTLHFLNIIANFERLYGFQVRNFIAIIPASKNPSQYLSELSAAADAAGARIVHSVERSAVAASYYDSITPGCRTVLVFELGGHFLEISLLTEDPCLNIKAAVSDLGCPLFNLVVSDLHSRLGNGFTSDANTLYEIRTECERAKDALCLGSATVEVKFNLPGMVVRKSINREWLVRLNLFHLRFGIMRCLMEAGVSREAVDEVVLAGASTNIPAVRRVLQEFFQRQPFRCSINPANLIKVSSKKYKDIISNLLDIPVVGLLCLNLGLYRL